MQLVQHPTIEGATTATCGTTIPIGPVARTYWLCKTTLFWPVIRGVCMHGSPLWRKINSVLSCQGVMHTINNVLWWMLGPARSLCPLFCPVALGWGTRGLSLCCHLCCLHCPHPVKLIFVGGCLSGSVCDLHNIAAVGGDYIQVGVCQDCHFPLDVSFVLWWSEKFWNNHREWDMRITHSNTPFVQFWLCLLWLVTQESLIALLKLSKF